MLHVFQILKVLSIMFIIIGCRLQECSKMFVISLFEAVLQLLMAENYSSFRKFLMNIFKFLLFSSVS